MKKNKKEISLIMRNDLFAYIQQNHEELFHQAFSNKQARLALEKEVRSYIYEKYGKSSEYAIEDYLDDLVGLGEEIQSLLENEEITDVQWDGNHLIVQNNKKGRYIDSDIILSHEQVEQMVRKIGNIQNKLLNQQHPNLQSVYGNNRVNAQDLSISPYGITFSMRVTRPSLRVTKDDKKEYSDLLNLIRALLSVGLNVVISGETGSGKTEIQKSLLGDIPDDQVIIVIEDTGEMHIKEIYPQKMIMSWLTTKTVSIEDLIRPALRNNPDYLIISETRGSEAYDMYKAMQTGHHIITTVHAPNATSIIARFDEMCKSANPRLETETIRRGFCQLFDIGIHMKMKIVKGKIIREVTEIIEFIRYQDQEIIINPLYQVDAKVVKGKKGKLEVEKTIKKGRLSYDLSKRFLLDAPELALKHINYLNEEVISGEK